MKYIVLSALLLLPAAIGCEPMTPAATPPPKVEQPSQAVYLPASTVKPEAQPSASAVDTAMMWADKYAKAMEDLADAQERARTAERGQEDAEKQVRQLQRELEQVQKELDDANKMMLVLKGDLEQWKRDVLGFRKDIMEAQTAQLDALRQIMKVLGGELAEPVAPESQEGQP